MDVSFVILAWNSRSFLDPCLASIARSLRASPLSHEILILDNGSSDGSAEHIVRLAEQRPDLLKAFLEPVNLGTTRSRNKLLQAARGDYICVMDCDAELNPGVVDRLIEELRDPRVGIAAPRIVYPSGAWQKSYDRFPTLQGKFNRFLTLRRMERREAANDVSRPPFAVDYAISAFWMMRRALIAEIGALDENIFYAPEDADYCLRVWQAGKQVRYVPTVTIVHHTQEISRGMGLDRAKMNHMKGLAYYFRKHGYLWRSPSFAVPQER